ncbi:hypothetical protein O181_029553 [Austropuccinia psidii MF-1]|uniref:Uncharacterized protein n=1 Tax=Austropuccinia psidii MF-1 TaxID=1389203 RepID=A0A9Q3CVX8_9BASI|nr:hypothetical protein [Austropuccinia psidii MF-1]
MKKLEDFEIASTLTRTIPVSILKSYHDIALIITHSNQPKQIALELFNLYISSTLQIAQMFEKNWVPVINSQSAPKEGIDMAMTEGKGENLSGISKQSKGPELVAFVDEKEEQDPSDQRVEGKQPTTNKGSFKAYPSDQKKKFEYDKEATSSEQGKRAGTSYQANRSRLHSTKDSTSAM